MGKIENDWLRPLGGEFSKAYYKRLYEKVKFAYETRQVFPKPEDLFAAFEMTPFQTVKVVILGQDPYHNEGEAHGLCFSVRKGVKIPPSLQNIFRELQADLGISMPKHGCLNGWAKQGVLLLNTVLTVEAHKPGSHRGMGWEEFTDAALKALSRENRPMVFILWGSFAREKRKWLQNERHLILEAPHPSPLSAYRGFFGSKPFSKVNEFLVREGVAPIDWNLEE